MKYGVGEFAFVRINVSYRTDTLILLLIRSSYWGALHYALISRLEILTGPVGFNKEVLYSRN